jgi:hypothetical protein
VRTGSGWKLKSFEAIYQKDNIMAVNPAKTAYAERNLSRFLAAFATLHTIEFA